MTGDCSNPQPPDDISLNSLTVDACEGLLTFLVQNPQPKEAEPADTGRNLAAIWLFVILVAVISILAACHFWNKLAFESAHILE